MCVLFLLSKIIGFYLFSTIFPFSFAFLSVCNESEGSTRQLEYLYSPVVEKVCCYLFMIEWEGRTGKYLARGHNVYFRFFFFSSFSSHLVGAVDHFWPSSNHHKGPSYGGVFVKCFSVKARGGPEGSYDNSYYDI